MSMDGSTGAAQSRMRRTLIAAVSIASLGLAGTPVLAGDSKTPLEVFGNLPTLEDLVLSPDGTKEAYVQTSGDQRNLHIRTLAQPQALGAVRVGDVKQRSIEWMDNDNLLIEASSASIPPNGLTGPLIEWRQLLTYNVPKKKLALMNFQMSGERAFNVTTGTPMVREVNGATSLFIPGLYMTLRTMPGLFKYDVADERMRITAAPSQWRASRI
jgi:hypothetical protein